VAAGLQLAVRVDEPPAEIEAGVAVKVQVGVESCTEKVAVTFFAASIVTLHTPVPVQSPLQPVKVEPDAGVAVRLTPVPLV
jgi:hypothetical protein